MEKICLIACLMSGLVTFTVANPLGGAAADAVTCAFQENADPSGPTKEALVRNLTRADPSGTEDAIVLEVGQEIGPGNASVRCHRQRYCYALWLNKPKQSVEKTSFMKGCFTWNGECTDSCVLHAAGHANESTLYFCCCRGNMCNSNVSDPGPGLLSTTSSSLAGRHRVVRDGTYKKETIIIALTSVVLLAVLVVATFGCYRYLALTRHRAMTHSLSLSESPAPSTFELDDLKLSTQIYHGRYAEVWRGSMGDVSVAVKVFPSSQKQNFLNEREVYSVPHMADATLVKFYGTDEEILPDGGLQYRIVLEYVTKGSLNTYLKNNTLDWYTLCSMCQSVSAGLAHLHTDVTRGGVTKPAVAHRDFNSRNILVRDDLTCVVADLGFSIQINGSKYIRNGLEESAEHASLTDVGTLRYMAPEVLDGAVNLRDCEASLKQIDVYSLGLVLWEVATRCTDLYQGLPTPEYKLPYQAEVGLHPSIEDMQGHVSRDKRRPAFPDVWKDTNQALRALKETLDECWDQDSEARLTALCVRERIADWSLLWEARMKTKGLSPASLSTTTQLEVLKDRGLGTHENPTRSHENPTSDRNDPADNAADGVTPAAAPSGGRHSPTDHVGGPTIETNSTSDELPECVPLLSKDDVNSRFERENRHREPVPGRNQIVDRNTHKKSDEELTVHGNSLVGDASGSSKGDIDRRANDLFGGPTTVEDHSDSALVPNESLNVYTRPPNNPIPYLQNEVGVGTRPKRANVPGNGRTDGARKHKLKPKRSKDKFLKLLPSFMSRSQPDIEEPTSIQAVGHQRSHSDDPKSQSEVVNAGQDGTMINAGQDGTTVNAGQDGPMVNAGQDGAIPLKPVNISISSRSNLCERSNLIGQSSAALKPASQLSDQNIAKRGACNPRVRRLQLEGGEVNRSSPDLSSDPTLISFNDDVPVAHSLTDLRRAPAPINV